MAQTSVNNKMKALTIETESQKKNRLIYEDIIKDKIKFDITKIDNTVVTSFKVHQPHLDSIDLCKIHTLILMCNNIVIEEDDDSDEDDEQENKTNKTKIKSLRTDLLPTFSDFVRYFNKKRNENYKNYDDLNLVFGDNLFFKMIGKVMNHIDNNGLDENDQEIPKTIQKFISCFKNSIKQSNEWGRILIEADIESITSFFNCYKENGLKIELADIIQPSLFFKILNSPDVNGLRVLQTLEQELPVSFPSFEEIPLIYFTNKIEITNWLATKTKLNQTIINDTKVPVASWIRAIERIGQIEPGRFEIILNKYYLLYDQYVHLEKGYDYLNKSNKSIKLFDIFYLLFDHTGTGTGTDGGNQLFNSIESIVNSFDGGRTNNYINQFDIRSNTTSLLLSATSKKLNEPFIQREVYKQKRKVSRESMLNKNKEQIEKHLQLKHIEEEKKNKAAEREKKKKLHQLEMEAKQDAEHNTFMELLFDYEKRKNETGVSDPKIENIENHIQLQTLKLKRLKAELEQSQNLHFVAKNELVNSHMTEFTDFFRFIYLENAVHNLKEESITSQISISRLEQEIANLQQHYKILLLSSQCQSQKPDAKVVQIEKQETEKLIQKEKQERIEREREVKRELYQKRQEEQLQQEKEQEQLRLDKQTMSPNEFIKQQEAKKVKEKEDLVKKLQLIREQQEAKRNELKLKRQQTQSTPSPTSPNQ